MISEFPLLVFTVFAGVAAGTYFVTPFFEGVREGGRLKRVALPLICIVLLGIGLLGTLAHLQHPERFLNAFVNPTAMIAQEAYWSIAFGVVLVIDLLLSALRAAGTPRAVKVVGAVFALGLMVVTGLAYAMNYGVPAWRGWATFPLFLFGDIAVGLSLFAAMHEGAYERKTLLAFGAVAEVLLGIALIGFVLQLFEAGEGVAPAVVALVLAPCGALACAILARKEGKQARMLAWISFACVLVSIVVARYAFYAACPF